MASQTQIYILVLFGVCCIVGIVGQEENRGDGRQWKRCYQCYHERRNQYDASYYFNLEYGYMKRAVDGASFRGGIPYHGFCTPNRTYSINGVLQDYLPSSLEKTCSRDWYCVKDLVELNYRNYFVVRQCRQQCRERWKTLADGTKLIRECCEDDLCNSGRDVTSSRVSVTIFGALACVVTSLLRKIQF
ncbi:uncharacterized protein LOC141914084 [Tubulanus polymorphus]|uniref:uncharacterized protein LOC141914084 n=1 Tax=Tubulanus polymorphus TaxID=672921 RepID=UPI003DA27F66